MWKHEISLLTIVFAASLACGCSGDKSALASPDSASPDSALAESTSSDSVSPKSGLATAKGDAENSAAKAGTPADAIRGMLALAQAGKWEEYVSNYYGEQHKMDKPDEQIPIVAARIEKMGPKLIDVLKGCLGQHPMLCEDGDVATFPNSYKLYKGDGSWGFHL
jgi:hypothetical protein